MKLRILIALVAVIFAALQLSAQGSSESDREWARYKAEYEKVYFDAAIDAAHKEAFFKNKKMIAEHNAQYDLGQETWAMGETKFSDFLPEEFKEYFQVPNTDLFPVEEDEVDYEELSYLDNYTAPDNWDWREHNAVTPAKNQKSCGTCWIFASVAAIEAQVAIHEGQLHNLSEQNIMDCLGTGCKAGFPKYAFSYVIRNKGIDLSKYYPYSGHKHTKCMYSEEYKGGQISRQRNLSGNEKFLKKVIARYGPVAASLNSTGLAHYKHGILEYNCTNHATIHSVAIVGYGEIDGQKYWIGKNSWGHKWGEKGFFRMARGYDECGISDLFNSPAY